MAVFKLDGNGMKELSRNLQHLAEGISEGLDFEALFPPAFMQTHTKEPDFAHFMAHSGFPHETDADISNIPDEAFDAYVRKASDFDSWKAMLEAGTHALFEQNLK